MLNEATVMGYLGKDPESRSFQSGGQVVNLRIATTEKWKDRDGNQQERTEWHSVAIFHEKIAEIAERYLKKGSLVMIRGKLETRKWQDQSGQDRYATEIVLRSPSSLLKMVGRAGDDAEGGEARRPARRDEPRTASPSSSPSSSRPPATGTRWSAPAAGMDDDIPFAPETR